ncbi:MAG: hypothetical protein KAY24_12065 [Candidatus Eisenbacteria sp.]|nr:hypothetical protein [Candidatus Eisenbacteria bacterium]
MVRTTILDAKDRSSESVIREYWSKVCEAITPVEQMNEDDDHQKRVERSLAAIQGQRAVFTQVNLVLDPEPTQAFSKFYSDAVGEARRLLNHELKPDPSRYRAFGNYLARARYELLRHLSIYLGLEKPLSGHQEVDAISCVECGGVMVRNGASYRCHNCGSDSGCR